MVYSSSRLSMMRKEEVGRMEWDDPKQSVSSMSGFVVSGFVAKGALEYRQQPRFYPLLCPQLA